MSPKWPQVNHGPHINEHATYLREAWPSIAGGGERQAESSAMEDINIPCTIRLDSPIKIKHSPSYLLLRPFKYHGFYDDFYIASTHLHPFPRVGSPSLVLYLFHHFISASFPISVWYELQPLITLSTSPPIGIKDVCLLCHFLLSFHFLSPSILSQC